MFLLQAGAHESGAYRFSVSEHTARGARCSAAVNRKTRKLYIQQKFREFADGRPTRGARPSEDYRPRTSRATDAGARSDAVTP